MVTSRVSLCKQSTIMLWFGNAPSRPYLIAGEIRLIWVHFSDCNISLRSDLSIALHTSSFVGFPNLDRSWFPDLFAVPFCAVPFRIRRIQQTGVYPYPLAAGSARPNPKRVLRTQTVLHALCRPETLFEASRNSSGARVLWHVLLRLDVFTTPTPPIPWRP